MNKQFDGLLGNRVRGCVILPGCMKQLGGIKRGLSPINLNLAGIVVETDSGLAVRHATYIRFLLSKVVDATLIERAIKILLQAFSLYQAPIVKHAPKRETAVYKAIVNHKFLFEVLKGNQDMIFGLYKSLEKRFEQDGLYWLQYGLSLRDFGFHDEALEKLRVACQAHPMEHTEHALARQFLIVATLSNDKHRALGYLEDAKTILERLDITLESDDTYPLVTLAEGHTKIVKQYDGESAGRAIAKKYAELLQSKAQRFPDEPRLKESFESMFRYATTGTWTVSNGTN